MIHLDSNLIRKPTLPIIFLAFLSSIILGVLPAYLSEDKYLLIFLILLILFVFLSDHRFEILLWLCPLIFLFAQFPIMGLDILRWISLLVLVLFSVYTIRKQKIPVNSISIGLGAIGIYSIATSALSYYPTISLLKSISLLLFSLFILVYFKFSSRLI